MLKTFGSFEVRLLYKYSMFLSIYSCFSTVSHHFVKYYGSWSWGNKLFDLFWFDILYKQLRWPRCVFKESDGEGLAHLCLWWLSRRGVESVGPLVWLKWGRCRLSWAFGCSDGKVLAQFGLWWLRRGGLAQLDLWWLIWVGVSSFRPLVAQMGRCWLSWGLCLSWGDVAQLGLW
jgi:hypothetical protein